ncbi:hypothetical protein KKF34_00060 [Myxococcota bacterium]|nr:hypothetical protein [Myxococcota bacterium]MBU1382976.1 hypothetical protein [Myxococcota bacterium]MBU1495253.1 hypothetical protein [Myxococcota bacterium]
MPHNLYITILSLCILVPTLTSCTEKKQEKVLLEDPVYTDTIDFAGEGRILYEITGPDYETPNVPVGETTFFAGIPYVLGEEMLPELNYMPAYASSSTPLVKFTPTWKGEGPPPAGTWHLRGVLQDSSGLEIELFDKEGALEPAGDDMGSIDEGDSTSAGYKTIEFETQALPSETAKLYNLLITHTYTVNGTTFSRLSTTEFAQVWRAPLPGTILYYQIIRWGAEWLNGTFSDLGEVTENELADKLLLGMQNLVPLGYRYGSHGKLDHFTNKAEVFLDRKQSSCGDFYGFFMDLVETQGIDANYLIFYFPNPSPEWFSMYETIEIAALGREKRVWRYADHGLVEVNGRVYDPTYGLIMENADVYEDFLFARFCYGGEGKCGAGNTWCLIPGGPQGICSDNEPGYHEELGFIRVRGETY